MRTRLAIVTLTSIGVLMSGCTQAAGSKAPPRPLPVADVSYSTQVSTGPCVAGEEAVGLLATLAGAFIAKGVNRIGMGLQGAARAETITALARRNLELTDQGLGPCIVVARGWFYRKLPTGQDSFAINPASQFPMNSVEDVAGLWRMGLFVAATPDFYFQGRLVPNSNRTAYTVVPIHASLDRPISANTLRGDDRSMMIAFAVSAGGASSVQGGGSTVVLGRIRPGMLTTFPPPTCVVTKRVGAQASTSPETCPQGPTSPVDAIRIVRADYESEWFSPSLGKDLKTVTLLALVSETRDESKYLSFLSEVFTTAQPAVTTALQNELVPELGAAAEETDLAAREAAATAYDKALVDVLAALDGCIANPSDVAKRTGARVGLRSFVAAARKADLPVSINENHIVGIEARGTTPDACLAARSALPI